jgi:hypothetical protein
MNIIPLVIHIAELALLAIILWHVVSAQWPMGAPMIKTCQGLIVLIVVLVGLSMIIGQPIPVGIPPGPPSLVR